METYQPDMLRGMEPSELQAATRKPDPMQEVVRRALVILNDEQIRPTINYRYVSNQWPRELRWDPEAKSKYSSPQMAGVYALQNMRKRLRDVEEDPTLWQLSSTNYDLIEALYVELKYDSDQTKFLTGLLRVKSREYVSPDQSKSLIFPSWNGHLSALPLLAEFAIRHGQFQLLLDVVSEVELPNASMAVMWRQLQETGSLNFNVFSEADLRTMPENLTNIRELAERQTYSERGHFRHAMVKNEHYKEGFKSQGREIVSSIDAFLKLCAQQNISTSRVQFYRDEIPKSKQMKKQSRAI
jgi:hypothetical protein